MIPFMENFGAHLTAVRNQFNVSLEDLSAMTEISEARLQDIETHNKPIFANEAHRIAQALGVMVGDLLGDPALQELAEDLESLTEDPRVFTVQGWLPHNVAITSLQDLLQLKSKPPRKGVLYQVDVSYLGTDGDVEKWHRNTTRTTPAMTVETLLEDET